MPRITLVFATLCLALVACNPTGTVSSTSSPEEPVSTGPTTSVDGNSEGGTTTTAVAGETTTTSGRPLAPDFTLELGDGGTYSLSEGAKPVYLVFWAEW